MFTPKYSESQLKQKIAKGGLFTISGQGTKMCLQILTEILIARMLMPEDYGIVALGMVFISFAKMFRDFGLSNATIQSKTITQEQVSSLFWVNVIISVIIFSILAILAPCAATIFKEPRLVLVIITLGITVPLAGASAQHTALLKRQLLFGRLAIIEVGAQFISFLVSALIAYRWQSYWAVVTNLVMRELLITLGVVLALKWVPTLNVNLQQVKKHIKFGVHVTGFQVVNYLSVNVDRILVGKFYGTAQLGIFDKAKQLLLYPLRQINVPVSNVMIPALSRLLDDEKSYRKTYIDTVQLLIIISMPAVALAIVTADTFIPILLGQHWANVAPIFKILGIVGLVQTIGNTTSWLYISQGRTSEFFRWGIVSSFLAVLLQVIGMWWGLKGMLVAWALGSVLIRVPLNYYFVTRKGPVKLNDFFQLYPMPLLITSISILPIIIMKTTGNGFKSNFQLLMALGLWATTYAILIIFIPPNKNLIVKILNGLKARENTVKA